MYKYVAHQSLGLEVIVQSPLDGIQLVICVDEGF